jgi:ABC-type transport system involved in multi-copper enzyme maturation permease subunit
MSPDVEPEGPYRVPGEAPTATSAPASPRAAIHDLGYKRYLGTRRPQSTRWRVIVRNHISGAWRGFWRMKAWTLGAAMTAIGFGVGMFALKSETSRMFLDRGTGATTHVVDAALPFSIGFFTWWAFVLSLSVGAAAVARDLKAGAFEFYFSRPVRPVDYVLGKFVGQFGIMATALVAPPFVLAAFRIGLAQPREMLGLVDLLPRVLAVGVLGAAAFAALPIGLGALFARPSHAIAAWVAYYLFASNVLALIAQHVGVPALGLLDPGKAMTAFALDLFGVDLARHLSEGGSTGAPAWLAALALVGHTAVGLAVTLWRVRVAERAGLGGG